MPTAEPFDAGRPYRCARQVALRPEPFGALVYHFGTRRLSFLKTPTLVRVVRTLAEYEDVHAALEAAEVPDAQRGSYLAALADLAAAGTIEVVSGDWCSGTLRHSRQPEDA